jgi:hypothetical protein
MTTLAFTPNLARHVDAPGATVRGDSLHAALEAYFTANPRVRGYVLDDQGAVRKHVAIFVNQRLIRDRQGLTDPIGEDDEIFVAQALSGG